jgi:alpha-galactosidase
MAKIVIIGGGSPHWGPPMIRDLVVSPELEGSRCVLLDIDLKKAELIKKIGERVRAKLKVNFEIEATSCQEEALQGAEYVILTISTGGLESMRGDLEIPLKYGIYQSVGDTVGPGGISRALRNIPVVVEIGKAIEKLCPNAWLINYTNPMTTLTRSLTRVTKVKTIGLCHEHFGVEKIVRDALNIPPEAVAETKVAGINHCIWLLDLKVNGEDLYPDFREYASRFKPFKISEKEKQSARARKQFNQGIVGFELLKKLGYYPVGGDRHIAEFFPYFLKNGGKEFGIQLTTIEDRYEWLAEDTEQVQRIVAGKEEIKLAKSTEAASFIISELSQGEKGYYVMNLPNKGQVSNLPPEVVIETPGVISQSEAQGIAIGDIPEVLKGILLPHIISQELTVEAALKGDKKLLLQAFLLSPLTSNSNFKEIEKMVDELLFYHRKYLPQFF